MGLKKVLFLLLLFQGLLLFSNDVSLGLEMSYQQKLYTEEDDQWAGLFDVTLMPTLYIHRNETFDIAPYLVLRYEKESDENQIQESSPDIYKDLNRLSLGAGSGFYWRFVNSSHIDVYTGFKAEILAVFPQWGDSAPTGYYNFDPGTGAMIGQIDIPLSMELNPLGDFKVRFGLRMFRFSLRIDEDYYRDDIIEQSISVFSSSPFWENDTQAVSISFIF